MSKYNPLFILNDKETTHYKGAISFRKISCIRANVHFKEHDLYHTVIQTS